MLPVHLALHADKAFARYRVSGLIEFSYQDDEVRSRGITTSSRSSFSQLYGLNFSSPVMDPRFMLLRASIQDTITSFNGDANPDQDLLTYDLGMTLFPGLRVSADLFGRKSVATIGETVGSKEYDVETTSYGGSLMLRLGGAPGRNGNYRNNRNNNNASNNNGGSWFGAMRSTINLSHAHTEAESLSTFAPREETRDNSSASASFQVNSALAVEVAGGLEKYENVLLDNGYKTTHAGAVARYAVARDAELRIEGRMAEREADNISAVLSDEEVLGYGIHLDIKGKDRLRQNYSHTVTRRKQPDTLYDDQNTTARLTWQLREKFYAVTGVHFRAADFEQDPSVLVPQGIVSSFDTGAVLGGAGYTATFTPSFLRIFAVQTDYEFNAGYSKYATNEQAVPQGSGTYYVNRGGIQLNSTAWQNDSLNMGYQVVSQRDDSPLNYDFYDTMASLMLKTTRLPRTSITGQVKYSTHRLSSDGGSVFTSRPVVSLSDPLVNQLGKVELRRGFTYIVDTDHRLSDYLSLLAGASRGQQVAETATLSTLTIMTDDTNFLSYGSVRLNYPITRNLTFRADAREEYRSRLVTRTHSHIFESFLDLRIRKIFLSLEYRLREDAPTNDARTVRQLMFAKLSRPF